MMIKMHFRYDTATKSISGYSLVLKKMLKLDLKILTVHRNYPDHY